MKRALCGSDATSQERVVAQWAVGLAFLLLLAAAVFAALEPPGGTPRWINHDAALLLRIGGDLVDGATLYVERMENNPPAIFVATICAAAVAKCASISAVAAFHVAVLAAVALGSLLLWRGTHAWSVWPRVATLFAYLVVALAFGSEHFGQRPHLFLIVFLPWAVRRLESRHTSVPLLVFGGLVGAATAMKPQYAVFHLVLEVVLVARDRQAPVRVWAALACGALFPFTFVELVSPGSTVAFFRDVVPMVLGGSGYTALNVDAATALSGRWGLRSAACGIALLGVATFALVRRVHWSSIAVLTVIPAVAFAVVVQQGKYYAYHFVPFLGLVCFLAVWVASRERLYPRHERFRRLCELVVVGAVCLAAVATTTGLARTWRAGMPQTGDPTIWFERDARVLVLSTTVAAQVEVVGCERHVRLVGKWAPQRLRVQLLLDEALGDRDAAADAYRADVADELDAAQPDLVFVSITRSPALRRSLADVLRGSVLPGPRFERVPDEEVARLGHAWEIFEVYRRRADR